MNPLDATAAGIVDGDLIDVTSSAGTISGRARVSDDVIAGAVSIPHGLVDQNVSVLTSSGVGHHRRTDRHGRAVGDHDHDPAAGASVAIAVTDAWAIPLSERSSAAVPGSTSCRT